MTAKQFNAALVKLGFCKLMPNGVMSKGQVEFANKLRIGERSVRRWASGQWPVPTTIAALLNLMLKTGSTAEDLKL
jgi:hypothetical protein